MAVCLLEIADGGKAGDETKEKERKEMKKEATKLMGRVPDLRQKIAGKSIPLEVRLLCSIIHHPEFSSTSTSPNNLSCPTPYIPFFPFPLTYLHPN